MPSLNWIGKEAVVNHHNHVPFHLLRDVPELSVGEPGAGNLIVQGDNLVALKALLPYYAGQVKCIYIDPPYNTGNEGWIYNDNVTSPVIRKWLGEVVGKEGETLDRHDRWLCMMYPRLALLRQFLREDGVILVSIDDNEIHHLRALMDEVFGSQTFVASIAWRSSDNSNNDAKQFSSDYNHTVVYSRTPDWLANRTMDNGTKRSHFKNPDNDPRGPWFDGNPLNSPNPRPNLTYNITSPSGFVIRPPKNGWRWSRETLNEKLKSGEIRFTEDGRAIRRRTYLADMKGLPPSNLWVDLEETGHNRQAKYELMNIFDTDDSKQVFATPKLTRLIERILQIATKPGDLILDSFAGSGTTGHAVLKLNAALAAAQALECGDLSPLSPPDGLVRPAEPRSSGSDNADTPANFDGDKSPAESGDKSPHSKERRFILVEIESKIARDITAERVKRVAQGYTNAKGEKVAGLGGGFRFCELGEPLFDETGKIRDTVRFADLARHVYFTETGEPFPELVGDDVRSLTSKSKGKNQNLLTSSPTKKKSPLLGITAGGVAVYLLYNGILKDKSVDGGNVLTNATLALLPTHAGPRVIYAAGCRFSRERQKRENITFKQTPYAIRLQ